MAHVQPHNTAQATEMHASEGRERLYPLFWTSYLVHAPFAVPIANPGSTLQPFGHSPPDYSLFAASTISLPLPSWSPPGQMPSSQSLHSLPTSEDILGPDFHCLRQCVSQMVSRCGLGLVSEQDLDLIATDAFAHISSLCVGYVDSQLSMPVLPFAAQGAKLTPYQIACRKLMSRDRISITIRIYYRG